MQATRIQPTHPRHQIDGRVAGAVVVALTVLAVWALSGLQFENQALDAIPATASLARDIASGLWAIVWQPLAALAAVLLTAILIVAVGRRATVKHPRAV